MEVGNETTFNMGRNNNYRPENVRDFCFELARKLNTAIS